MIATMHGAVRRSSGAARAAAPERSSRAFRDVVARGDFILGAAVERFESRVRRLHRDAPRDRRRRPAGRDRAGVARVRGRAGRRGHHAGQHLHRHGAGDLAVGATPVFVDMDAATYCIDPGGDRRGDHLAHQGDRAGASLRPAGRSRRGDGGRATPQPGRDRGRGAGARRALQGRACRQLRPRRGVQLLSVEEPRRARRRRA